MNCSNKKGISSFHERHLVRSSDVVIVHAEHKHLVRNVQFSL